MIRKNTLICDNLCVFRGKEMVLENVSFSLMPGACVRVVGENGSGKTSLLRCLARLDDSNHGKITYNSCCVDEFIDEYKQIILYISDKEQLNEKMTVCETISFWSDIYSAEMLLEPALRTLNLEEYLDIQIKYLSKGLKKRVALARLLLQRARIWLLDEPFVNLDVETVNSISNVMNSHLANGGIIVFSDHMQDNFNSTAKDIAQLKNMGYKVGSSSQLKKQETILVTRDFKRFKI